MTFGGHSLFVARVASFAPKQSEGTRDTNKLYALQESCDYHYYQHTRPNRTNLFRKERLFNMKSCCRLQIPFSAHTLFVNWLHVVVTIACKMSFDMLLVITIDDLDTNLLLDVLLLC